MMVFIALLWLFGASANAHAINVDEILARSDSVVHPTNLQGRFTMTLVSSRGDERVTEVAAYQKRVSETREDRLFLFTFPPSVEGTGLLVNSYLDQNEDRMIGILSSKSRRAEQGLEGIREFLLVTRYSPERVQRGEMLALEDVQDILSLDLIGVIPDSPSVLNASNAGVPVILDRESSAGQAYSDMVSRYLGEDLPHRFLTVEKKGLFGRLFRG